MKRDQDMEGERGKGGEEMKIELRCAVYKYQLPTKKEIVMYRKHILINIKMQKHMVYESAAQGLSSFAGQVFRYWLGLSTCPLVSHATAKLGGSWDNWVSWLCLQSTLPALRTKDQRCKCFSKLLLYYVCKPHIGQSKSHGAEEWGRKSHLDKALKSPWLECG